MKKPLSRVFFNKNLHTIATKIQLILKSHFIMVPKVANKMRFGAIIIYNGAESGEKFEIRQWYNTCRNENDVNLWRRDESLLYRSEGRSCSYSWHSFTSLCICVSAFAKVENSPRSYVRVFLIG